MSRLLDCRHFKPVATGALCVVESLVRSSHEPAFIHVGRRVAECQSEAQCDRELAELGDEWTLRDTLKNPLRNGSSARERFRAAKNDHELLAAVSTECIDLSDGREHPL